MKRLLRSLLLWLLLLALPCQGFAAAVMACADHIAAVPAAAHAAATAPHDHAAMMAGHAQPGHDGRHDHAGQGHAGAKCGGGLACCIGVAPAPAMAPALPSLAACSEAIPFSSLFPPPVDLAHPERPPQLHA